MSRPSDNFKVVISSSSVLSLSTVYYYWFTCATKLLATNTKSTNNWIIFWTILMSLFATKAYIGTQLSLKKYFWNRFFIMLSMSNFSLISRQTVWSRKRLQRVVLTCFNSSNISSIVTSLNSPSVRYSLVKKWSKIVWVRGLCTKVLYCSVTEDDLDMCAISFIIWIRSWIL